MNKPIRVVRIIEGTSVDGPGLRTSIYVAGCKHHCPGCHNEHTWPFDTGEDMSIDDILKVVDYNDFNVTFSGGDPFYQAQVLSPLAKAIKERGKTLWCYTGFTFEEIMKDNVQGGRELLDNIDVLVDGPFIEDMKELGLRFRGSTNQRMIDVPATLGSGGIVLWQD